MFEALSRYGLHWSFDAAGAAALARFEQSLPEAPDLNEDLLTELLRANAHTVFGEAHRFSHVDSPAAYAELVPLRDYEGFRDWVERIAEGEPNVLTAEPVRALGLTSGTTGRGKLVPVTASAQRQIIQHMVLTTRGVMVRHVEGRKPGPGLLLMSSVLPQTSKGGLPIGTATAAGLDRLGGLAKLLWSSPLEVFRVRSHPAAQHLHLLFALARRDLTFLSAPFASALVDLLRCLEADWPLLVEELAHGVISDTLALEPALRAALALPADPARAAEVCAELENGFERIVPRLWPDLRCVLAVVTGSFAVYEPALRRACGELPLYTGLYAASEGLLGIALEPETRRYVLDPQSMYFEFIPAERAEDPSPPTLPLRHVQRGELYEVVLTTRSGLYRYRLGDVVQVVGFRGRAPLVEYAWRRGMLLDLAGEKTSEPVMREAVLEAARHWGAELVDFSTRADYAAAPERYEVFVEVTDPQAPERSGAPAHTVDAALQLGNPGYKLLRTSQRLAPATLHLLRPGTFSELKALLVAQGASPVQVKVPRVLVREDLHRFVRERVEKTWAPVLRYEVRSSSVPGEESP